MTDSAGRCGQEAHIWVADGARSLSVLSVGTGAEPLGQLAYGLERLGIGREAVGRALDGMHDRRVVAAAEAAGYVGEREVGVLAREVHGDLARPHEAGGAAGGQQLVARDVEGLADRVLDRLERRSRDGARADAAL